MSSPVPSLTGMPSELQERILENLDLEDVRNFRLTCKTLGRVSDRFKSYFAEQTTDLTVDSLRKQHELASHPQLRSAVNTLVVMAAVFDTSKLNRMIKTKRHRIVEVKGVFTTTMEPNCTEEELQQAAADLKWMHTQQNHHRSQSLAESVDTLAAILSLYGTMDAISLDACVNLGSNKRVPTPQAGEWHPVIMRASEVYQITTSAIAKSRVFLNTFLVYCSTPRCSVPSIDVTTHMSQLESIPGFEPTFSSLENFALSFSTRVETDFSKIEAARARLEGAGAAYHRAMGSNAGQFSAEDPEATAEENFPGIARMLSKMTKLDAFDLHMIDALRGPSTGYEKIFAHIADEVKLPLTQVFLRGLPATEESLLKFIDNHPTISHLDIREMRLKSGSWTTVIQRICQMPALSRLHLSNLWDERGIFNLLSKSDDVETRREFQRTHRSYACMGGDKVHTRDFDRERINSLQNGLDFDDRDIGYALGSYPCHVWAQKRQFEYTL